LKLRVSREAEQELAAAVAWYEERSEGLGIELVIEVDRVFARILSRPLEAPLWREDPALSEEGPHPISVRRLPGFWTER
jgi:hypothetical protein